MNAVWANSKHQDGKSLLLLLAIADHINDADGWSWPSISTLAKRIRSRPRYVIDLLKELEDSGELVVERALGRPNRYRINLPEPVPTSSTGANEWHPCQPVAHPPVPTSSTPPVLLSSTLILKESLVQPLEDFSLSQEPVKKHPKGHVNGTRPCLEDVERFCVSEGLTKTDAEFMFNTWESNNWKTKNGPVKNWIASIRKYRAGGWLPSQKQPSYSSQTPKPQTKIVSRNLEREEQEYIKRNQT